MSLLLTLLGCLPLPLPDLRRPAALVVFEEAAAEDLAGVQVRVCTWSTRRELAEGCGDVMDGIPATDGVGVREWSAFPLVLRGRSPAWADIFVACRDGKVAGTHIRLPGFAPKWKAQVSIRLGETVKMGVSTVADISDAEAAALGDALCAGTVALYED